MLTNFRNGCVCASIFAAAAATGMSQSLQADLSFPYAAHHWNTTGFSADLGEVIAGQHFVGLEFTAFNPAFDNSFPTYGVAHVDEQIDTLLLAYRFTFPLNFSGAGRHYAPVELYVGGAGGLGRVRQSLTSSFASGGAPAQQASAGETELCAELSAGLQFNFGPHFGIKAGFRYIDSINNVRLFNTDAATDTKTLEAGVVCRF